MFNLETVSKAMILWRKYKYIGVKGNLLLIFCDLMLVL